MGLDHGYELSVISIDMLAIVNAVEVRGRALEILKSCCGHAYLGKC